MFAIELYKANKVKIQARTGGFEVGMALEKPATVKRKFTYRELTLLIGIVVAAIIAVTILIGQDSVQQVLNKHSSIPQISPVLNTQVIKEMISVVIF